MNEYEIFTEKIPHLVGTGYATGNELPIVRMDEEIQEDNRMSFVGINCCKDGLVAFADTKSTYIDELGNAHEEEGRLSEKVFHGKDFILVTHGLNRIKKDMLTNIPIENYIKENISQTSNAYEFFVKFNQDFCSYQSFKECSYYFGIGGKDESGWYVQMVEIKNGQVIFSQKYYKTFYNEGILFFKKFYCSNANRTVKESLDFTKNKLNMIMTEAKKVGTYIPVGFPFQFISMSDEGFVMQVIHGTTE